MTNLGSLLLYFIFFTFSIIFYNTYNKSDKKIFLILSFVFPLIIGGFRYNVGTDYLNYLFYYNNKIPTSVTFDIISSIARYFDKFYILFFIYSFLTLFFFYKGLEIIDKKYRTLSLCLFLFIYFPMTFNGIRQLLAVSIIFYLFKYIKDKKMFHWSIGVIIATMCHQTAILCLPFYFILNSKSKFIKFLLIIVMFFISIYYVNIIQFLSNYSFFSHYVLYTEKYVGDYGNKIFYLELLTLLYLILYRKKLIEMNEDNNIFYFAYEIGIILMFTGFFDPYVKRISYYFVINKIFLLAQLPYAFKDINNKNLNNFMIASYSILIFILMYYIMNQGNVFPYTWVFEVI